MKLLFIANRFPYPPYRGDKLKIYNLCSRLARHHEIHLITFAENRDDLQYIGELEKIFKQIEVLTLPAWKRILNAAIGIFRSEPLQVSYFRSGKFSRRLAAMLKSNTYDGIHVQHLRMARYASELEGTFRILDLPDAFSLYWERRKQIPRSAFSAVLDRIESARVWKYEKYMLKCFNLNLVCSVEDLTHLEKEHGVKNIALLPNGVDTDVFYPRQHDYGQAGTLLFTGNMDYDPNIDAVIYFTEEILPLIRLKFPDVTFLIAGQRPVEKVKNLHNGSNVLVTGFVEDLTEVYNAAGIVVAPLRFGAGTQNKVLEAMAMGIPVVCSNIGFAGLGISDGEGAFMRTDAAGFSEAVCMLLASRELREKTGKKGLEVIQKSFSWDTVAATLENYFLKKSER